MRYHKCAKRKHGRGRRVQPRREAEQDWKVQEMRRTSAWSCESCECQTASDAHPSSCSVRSVLLRALRSLLHLVLPLLVLRLALALVLVQKVEQTANTNDRPPSRIHLASSCQILHAAATNRTPTSHKAFNAFFTPGILFGAFAWQPSKDKHNIWHRDPRVNGRSGWGSHVVVTTVGYNFRNQGMKIF